MNINKVIIENFGLYNGLQEINLQTNKLQNIILIGGKNGNGKTTLFEAIRFCLYGPAMFEKRPTSKEYDTYLRERIHHNQKEKPQAKHAKIEIEFDHAELGRREIYIVSREWEIVDSDIKEKLIVMHCDSTVWQEWMETDHRHRILI